MHLNGFGYLDVPICKRFQKVSYHEYMRDRGRESYKVGRTIRFMSS